MSHCVNEMNILCYTINEMYLKVYMIVVLAELAYGNT